MYSHEFYVGLEDLNSENLSSDRFILRILENTAGYHVFSVTSQDDYKEEAWVIINWRYNIIRRFSYGQRIIGITWIENADRGFAHRNIILIDDSGEIYVTASVRAIFMNLRSRTIATISDDMRESIIKYRINDINELADYVDNITKSFSKNSFDRRRFIGELSALMDSFNTRYRRVRVKNGDILLGSASYTITRSDLDNKGHVHNLSYLDIAYNCMPQEHYTDVFSSVEIEYIKEITGDDTVVCETYQRDLSLIVVIKCDDEIRATIQYTF